MHTTVPAWSAITTAAANHMETTMAITAGSSIQIALLAAPLLVLASPLLGHPLDLTFSLFEVAIFALVAALFTLISLDGESNWLEGLLLLAFYLILAVGTFVAPMKYTCSRRGFAAGSRIETRPTRRGTT